jgi:hypothetical protein
MATQHVATLASLYRYHKHDYEYPKSQIDVCWEKVLLNQCKWLYFLSAASKPDHLLSTVHDGMHSDSFFYFDSDKVMLC